MAWPVESFGDLHEVAPYARALFVLGNSHHNLPALEAALSTRRMGLARSVYLHDGRLGDLWFSRCGDSIASMIRLYSLCYADGGQMNSFRSHWQFAPAGFLGIRPLVVVCGIDHFIVNSERARRLVERELAPDLHARVDVVFLPVDRVDVAGGPPFERRSADEIVVGTFGMPDPIKGTARVVAAARLLSRSRPVRLVIAGWGAHRYVRKYVSPRDRNFVTAVDSPVDEEMFRWMKWVDVAVQLREAECGESSGVLAQLVGVGRKPVAASSLIDPALAGRTIPVAPDIADEDLAAVIAAARFDQDSEVALEEVSSIALGRRLARIVTERGEQPQAGWQA